MPNRRPNVRRYLLKMDVVREMAVEKHQTMKQFASVADVSYSHLMSIAGNAQKRLKPDTTSRLAEALGAEITEIAVPIFYSKRTHERMECF